MKFPPFTLPLSEREAWQRSQPFPSHPQSEYDCPCVACANWRAAQVLPGMLVRPMTHNTSVGFYPGVSSWLIGMWETTGWSQTFESLGITHGLALFFIDRNDKTNAGSLNCIALLCSNGQLRVTLREWLRVLNEPSR